jgi:chromosome segregation ATPase
LNYATENKDGETKKAALAALDRGTLFASISKMTSNRLMADHEAKMRSLEEGHVKKMNAMENHYKEEKCKFKLEIESLKSQLKIEKEANKTIMEELNAAEIKREEAVKAAIQKEQTKASEMEKDLRTDLAGVQLKNMDLIDQLESVQLDLDDSRAAGESKDEEIEALKRKLEDVTATLLSTQTSLESSEKVAKETQEKLLLSEQSNAQKDGYITHLEESLLKAQNAVMNLAQKQTEMQKAMEAQNEMLNTMLLAHNASSGNVGGLLVDMIGLADDIGGSIKKE